MVNSGRVIIDVYNEDKKEWSETSVATSTNANYLQEVQDEADMKKAEAEYEHELDIINRKDTKFDQDLSKLETERTSITTEVDSIKKVRDDNIERTFGIFSLEYNYYFSTIPFFPFSAPLFSSGFLLSKLQFFYSCLDIFH